MLKLKTFEYPQYTISDPSLNFYASTHGINAKNDSFTKNNGLSIYGYATGMYKFTTIRPGYWLDVNTSLSIVGGYDEFESIVQYDTTLSKSKELSARSSLHAQYEYHPFGKLFNNIAFTGVTIDNQYSRYWVKRSNYESTNDYDDLTGKAEIGISFRKPIKPLYTAFEMERKLKEAGVLSDTLTSGTLQDLSKIVIASEKLKLRHEKAQKFIMEQIDSVLVKDSAINKSKIDAFALFKISEALEVYFEEIYVGLRLSLGIAGVGKWQPSGYYNPQTDHRGTDDDYKAVMELALSYTVPVCARLFFYTQMTKKESGWVDDFEHNFKHQIVNVGVRYILTNRLIANYGVNGISCKYFFPENKSISTMVMDLNYYLEDNVKLELYGSMDYSGLSKPVNSDERRRSYNLGMKLQFGL
jgi:hypothetical protein